VIARRAAVLFCLCGAALSLSAAPQDVRKLIGQHHTFCGIVEEVGSISKECDAGLYFSSYSERPTFAAIIPRTLRTAMPVRPEEYLFANVCVSGTVIESPKKNVPVIRIDRADQIRTVKEADRSFGAGLARPCDDGAVAPVVVKDAKAQFTKRALMDTKARGPVWVETIVVEDGGVLDARIVRALHPDLDREALAAVRQFEFKPGTVHGKPVPMVVVIETTFTTR
jgi:TonB family protein